MRKILSVVLCLIIIGQINFADSSKISAWAEDDVQLVKELNLFDERMSGRYQSPITRADFAYLGVILYQTLTGKKVSAGDASFPDTTDSYVLKAKNLGIVSGYPDGTFAPDNYITRQEIAKLFTMTLQKSGITLERDDDFEFADDTEIMSWAKKYVYLARGAGFISGVEGNRFDSDAYATREQSLVMVKRIIAKYIPDLSKEQTYSSEDGLDIGDRAPEFSLKTSDKGNLSLSDFRGQAVVLVFVTPNFKICYQQLDIVSKLQDDYKNINFMVINIDEEEEFKLTKEQANLSILKSNQKTKNLYAIDAVPTTIVIASDGRIVDFHSGKISKEELMEILNDL